MSNRIARQWVLAGLSLLASLAVTPAGATAIAQASLGFHDLGITPSLGTVAFTGPWELQAHALANNSLGEFDSPPDVILTGPGAATNSATVTWAGANAQATDPAPTPPYLDAGANAAASGHIPGSIDGSAIAQGQGTLLNSFMIEAGTQAGPVSVTFSVLVDYTLAVTTDQNGVLAEAEAVFSQLLLGDFGNGFETVVVNTLAPDLNDPNLDPNRRTYLLIGPSDQDQAGKTNLLLTNTLILQYGVPYLLLNQADAEIRVVNIPELDMATGAAPLVMVWLVALWRPAATARRKHKPV